MHKISDYSIIEILQAAGIETMRTGNNIVCRCPVCSHGETLKNYNHNAQVNVESNTLHCYGKCGGKTYTRTQIIELLNLYELLDIERFYENKYRRTNRPNFEKENIKQTQAPVKITAASNDKTEIEKLLKAEIPPILWDRSAESFKAIKLTHWNGQNRLLITAPNASTITRNAGSIKWKWNGTQPIFNRLTGKSLVFLASGVAEWLILDWLGLDYIVLPSDSKRAGLADFKEQLDGKAVIVLPDHDKSGSFDKVIETVKQVAERVHICFYHDKDFRDYCRRTSSDFNTKEQFIDSMLYNIFYELGGNESAELISEDDIYKLIPLIVTEQHETEPVSNIFDNYLMFVKPKPLKFILKGFRESTVGIYAGPGGAGKSYTALAYILSYADTSKKINYLDLFNDRRGLAGYISLEDDKELIHHRLYNLMQFFNIQKNDELIKNFQISCLYGQNFNLAEKNFNKIEINKEAEQELLNFCMGKKFVVIDTLRRLSNLNENDSSEMSCVLRCIESISFKTGCSILINSHVSKADQKGKDKVRGASSITDDTRFTMLLEKDKDVLTLSWAKVNAIRISDPILLKWKTWIREEEEYSMIVRMEDKFDYGGDDSKRREIEI